VDRKSLRLASPELEHNAILHILRLIPMEHEEVGAPFVKGRIAAAEAAVEVYLPGPIRERYAGCLLA
jgi:hypothetical protein